MSPLMAELIGPDFIENADWSSKFQNFKNFITTVVYE